MRDDGDKHDGPQRTSPYPTSRLAPVHDLVDVARQIADADAMLGAVASAELTQIADQIRALQERARVVLDAARESLSLHHARCSFVKRPGHVYHLYRKKSDAALYWSMLSPEEWGTPPDEFQGSFRLEVDMTWTPLEELAQRDGLEEPLRKLLR